MTQKEPIDYIGYHQLIDKAMRQVVSGALQSVKDRGITGDHHLYMTFKTRHPGVRIPSYLLANYPSEMGVVLQHQFWHLDVSETEFSVVLKFEGKPEKLIIPFDSLLLFADKGVNFSLRFTPIVPDPSRQHIAHDKTSSSTLRIETQNEELSSDVKTQHFSNEEDSLIKPEFSKDGAQNESPDIVKAPEKKNKSFRVLDLDSYRKT